MFCNFLLADEINRAPAKVQSALLEVMQERQVTIGHETHRVPQPFLVLATQNPIESEGTYPLPEAQVDRFMFKLVVDYPDVAATRSRSSSARSTAAAHVRQVLTPDVARAPPAAPRQAVYVDRRVMEYAVALTTATREPPAEGERHGSSSAPARAARSTSSTPAARWRCCAGATTCCRSDVRDLARDVLRHRIVLTYEALAAGVDADRVLDGVLERVPMPRIELRATATGARAGDELPRARSLLVGLALVPLALAAYVGAQRRRRRYAVRYTNVDLLAGVAGRVDWARHLPAAAGAARARRAAGRARAARSGRSPPSSDEATVVMVTDTSGSMNAKDVSPDRAGRRAARRHARSRPSARRTSGSASSRSARAPSSSSSRRPTAAA